MIWVFRHFPFIVPFHCPYRLAPCSRCLAADKAHLVAGDEGGNLHFWSLFQQDEDPMFTLHDAHTEAVSCVAVSNDGSCLVSGSDDFSVKVWERERVGEVVGI